MTSQPTTPTLAPGEAVALAWYEADLTMFVECWRDDHARYRRQGWRDCPTATDHLPNMLAVTKLAAGRLLTQ